jgi:hypothetical protein
MKVSKYKPHVLLLPEDDANRQLANGFCLSLPESTNIKILPLADGWMKVLDVFESKEISGMRVYSKRFMVLLIDFDNDRQRISYAKGKIPDDLENRVFVLGSLIEPQDLKRAGLGTLEEIGSSLAKDCREDTNEVWGHELLRHNAAELDRLREHVRPILFA